MTTTRATGNSMDALALFGLSHENTCSPANKLDYTIRVPGSSTSSSSSNKYTFNPANKLDYTIRIPDHVNYANRISESLKSDFTLRSSADSKRECCVLAEAQGMPSFTGPLLNEVWNECCSKEKIYWVAKYGLGGTACVGVAGTVGALIGGLPGVAVLTALLSAGTAIGAYTTHEAEIQLANARQAEELKRQIAILTTQNTAFQQNNAAHEWNVRDLRAENVILRQNVTNFSAQNAAHEGNVRDLRAQNVILQQNVDRVTAQNVVLQQNNEELNRQVAQFALQNQNYLVIAEQFRVYLEQFRVSHVQNREEFAKKLEELAGQLTASQNLWTQVLRDARAFSENYAAQLTQLRELITQLTDPRTTLQRMQEHQEINRQIQEAVSRLDQHQNRLASLDAQIALREGQLRERDQLLIELRSAHQLILTSYREQNSAFGARNTDLEAHIGHISRLLGQFTADTVAVSIYNNVGPGNVLGICAEPSWQIVAWNGHVPIGKAFKFVRISSGGITWEAGQNRILNESMHAQREIEDRPIQFG